jgi:hypothetical protein
MQGKLTIKDNYEAQYLCTIMALVKAASQMVPAISQSKVITGNLKYELNEGFKQIDKAINLLIKAAPKELQKVWADHYAGDQVDMAQIYELVAPMSVEEKRLVTEIIEELKKGNIQILPEETK